MDQKIHDEMSFKNNLNLSDVYIHFQDGPTFKAKINRPQNDPIVSKGIWGEAAFTTGMSGYEETATDPSFLGQHIIYTSSHIGNYKSNEDVRQSNKVHATCLIARNFSYNKFLRDVNVPLISDLDTRELTLYLSSKSKNHKSVINFEKEAPSTQEFENTSLICNKIEEVSIAKPEVIIEGKNPIVLMDYGCKEAIVQYLKDMKRPLVRMPHNTSAKTVIDLDPSLIFLSNGPGDPKKYTSEINVVKELLASKYPIRGICLGHQLLGLAMEMETLKLPFGQRGTNHPVFDHINQELLITSQNHGYAINTESFIQQKDKYGLFIEYTSLFDRSIEGMRSFDNRIRSVQFHPESNPGPKDAAIFFTEVENFLSGNSDTFNEEQLYEINDYHQGHLDSEISKILLIGSGPIKIGQASEFDYSGTQALKSLKELGFEVVLLNSNPATIMTDKHMSTKTYIEPITKDVIKKIIEKEKVDAILSTMGGQTALNLCIELEEEKYLANKGVKLLGANVETIQKTEDRELFATEMKKLGYKSGKRFKANDYNHAIELVKTKVEFPLIIRRDFALGGKGAALVYSFDELEEVLANTDVKYPITLEKSLVGWKELELEVMVDKNRNGVVICSIENVDPCGIHTGDSITVAPAQTISDRCYQQLRTMSLTIAKHMNVVAGGANVQFAINPKDEDDIIVIEMNPRVSRSSALASKATGYPIAKISAGLAVGLTLFDILNDITRISPVAFEPTLDYVAVKIPIFPFNKFPSSSQTLGPQMRSVGEVLALGGSFNEAFMKALRATEQGLHIPSLDQLRTTPFLNEQYIEHRLKSPKELCLLTILEGLRIGKTVKELFELSAITPWFIEQVNEFYQNEKQLKANPKTLNTKEILLKYKKLGFSDKYLALLSGNTLESILKTRYELGVKPVYKAVDTCSGEFLAKTPYFYSTYTDTNDATPFTDQDNSVAILGSGPNRIGQGIEFDYSCVKSCLHLKEINRKSIMINSNPETVSTDYDSSDRLYLSPLFSEDLFDILEFEKPQGVITSFSGQTGINIREHLESETRKSLFNINFYGPSLDVLDAVEDRNRFDNLVRESELELNPSYEVNGFKNLINTITEIGYPVIIRPSYVIGGESMYIFKSYDEIQNLPTKMKETLHDNKTTFQVERYLEDAIEYDVDLIRDMDGNTIFTICEHIEHAGVHSGDSGMISPPVIASKEIIQKMKSIASDLAAKLEITGPINFQFAVTNNRVYCIEANPRGSRTLPFLSKAYDINIPANATRALLGERIKEYCDDGDEYYIVKQSTFPFDRFLDDSIILGPKMRSTGETLGIDHNLNMAIMKSYLGNYPKLSRKGSILFSLSTKHKSIIDDYLKDLDDLEFEFFATGATAKYIQDKGFNCIAVSKLGEDLDGRSMLSVLKRKDLVCVVNTPDQAGKSKSDGEHIRNNSISYGVPCFTHVENIKSVLSSITHYHQNTYTPVNLQEMGI